MDKPTLNVIYDERRFEKYEPLVAQFEKYGIDYRIRPCVLIDDVVKSINASHKMIVREAKEKGLKEVYIGEDDLMFTCDDSWNYFLKNKPDNFDIYIGGTYFIDAPENWKPPLIKVKYYVGNHLIVVHEKYYDTFLSVPDNEHIDMAQGGRGDFVVCFPFPALQRPGFSSNSRAEVNYNSMLKRNPEWIYNG